MCSLHRQQHAQTKGGKIWASHSWIRSTQCQEGIVFTAQHTVILSDSLKEWTLSAQAQLQAKLRAEAMNWPLCFLPGEEEWKCSQQWTNQNKGNLSTAGAKEWQGWSTTTWWSNYWGENIQILGFNGSFLQRWPSVLSVMLTLYSK